MLATPARPHPGGKQGLAVSQDRDAILTKSMREALVTYLKGRKLVRVRIRQIDGSKIEGFLKIEGGKAERILLDFKATSTPEGGLSSLEVGGKKIPLDVGTTKRAR